MKHHTSLLTGLALAALAVGCSQEPTTSQQIDKLQTETQAAAQDWQEKDYTYAQKAEFTAKMQSQLAEINRQLDEVQNASESTWDSVKTTSKKAYADLKDGFNQSRQWVSDKIAP